MNANIEMNISRKMNANREIRNKKMKPLELSVWITTEYYRRNPYPFFNYMADDILWIGPYENQVLETKASVVEMLSNKSAEPQVIISDIRQIERKFRADSCEVFLRYGVHSKYSDGNTSFMNEQLHFTWRKSVLRDENGIKSSSWRIQVCHFSLELPNDKAGSAYRLRPEKVQPFNAPASQVLPCDRFLMEYGLGMNAFYIPYHMVLWAESSGISCIVHTVDGQSIILTVTLKNLTEKYSDLFMRVHASYAVNPAYIEQVTRRPKFSLILTDGSIIPIPEKRYTSIRRDITRRLGQKINYAEKS